MRDPAALFDDAPGGGLLILSVPLRSLWIMSHLSVGTVGALLAAWQGYLQKLRDPVFQARIQEFMRNPRVLAAAGGLVLLLLLLLVVRRGRKAKKRVEEAEPTAPVEAAGPQEPPEWLRDVVNRLASDGLVVQRTGSGQTAYNIKLATADEPLVMGVYKTGELWVYGSFHAKRAGDRFDEYLAAAEALTGKEMRKTTWDFVRKDATAEEVEQFLRAASTLLGGT